MEYRRPERPRRAHLPAPAYSISLSISGLPNTGPLDSKGAISPLFPTASGGLSRNLVDRFRSAFVEDAVRASSNPTGYRRCPAVAVALRSLREPARVGNLCNTGLYAYVGHKGPGLVCGTTLRGPHNSEYASALGSRCAMLIGSLHRLHEENL